MTQPKKREKFTANEKRCSKCLEVKPLDAFHANKWMLSGRQSWCKICVNGHVYERYWARKAVRL